MTDRSETTADADEPTGPDPDDEAIDEVGEESFPASDSPSSWSGPPTDVPPR
ncbi:MAG TPA: hypothetical protein VN816_06610 [Acidimicrobiales bacterium]|nr:hypothetical protein [Acidimicrobiales bacterium]